jgi:transposase InsO family protein
MSEEGMALSSGEFAQLRLKFTDPIQHDYELIRPIVLFSETISERSRQTGIERTQVGDKAQRFILKGMLGLRDQRAGHAGRKGHAYPEPVAAHMLYLKQRYPPIHYREIVRIIARKFGYTTNHVTVKHFLEQHAIPVQLELDFPSFHMFEDVYQAHWTVVHMWAEGWNKKSIAGCLHLSRRQVHNIIDTFQREGFAGLEDKRTRSPNHPANQLTLPFLKEVLDIQKEYPRAGRFRVRGLLEQQLDHEPPSEATIGRAMAKNRQFHGAPGPWESRRDEAEPDTRVKTMPYQPQYRHHIWFIDLRYLVKLDGDWVYSICVIDGYSRVILAGMASQYQDLPAVLQILFAAVSAYGCPAMIVSDNGKVFYAQQYIAILKALHIAPHHIEKGKPWQNLVETQFKIQLRLADYKFEHATTFEDMQRLHAEFIQTFNTTPHWAHRDREDGRRTPTQVLAWVCGPRVEIEHLHRIFRQIQFARTVNRYGFVSVQRFYLYVEQGLSRKRVSIWIHEGHLQIEYQQTLLAKYHCQTDRRQQRLRNVTHPTLYCTPYVSPQLEFFELDDEQWRKIFPRPYHRQQKGLHQEARQLTLPSFDIAVNGP